MSPLLFAIANNHDNIVRILLQAGADTSVQDNCGRSAVYWASELGNINCLKSLIEAKADINLPSNRLLTPLMRAIGNRHTKVVRLLLDASVNVAAESESGCTALASAVHGHQYDVVIMLLDAGARVNHVNCEGQTAVHAAAEVGDTIMLDLLISRVANVDTQDAFGMAPLVCSSQLGRDKCVSMLLRSGADVSKKMKNGSTALHQATTAPQPHLLSARLLSMASDRVRVVDILLSAGASVHDINEKGDSPLLKAAATPPHSEQVGIVQLLLDAGSNPDLSNNIGETCLMRAEELSVVKALLAAKASVDLLNCNGSNVLHYAGANARSTAVIMTLYQAGADATARDDAGKTPADYAGVNGHTETAKLLDLLSAKQRDERGAGAYTAPRRNGCAAALHKPIADPCPEEYLERVYPKPEEDNGIEVIAPKAPSEERKLRVEQACDHCGAMTRKRCSGCKITYFCSKYCQRAAYKAHKPACLALQEEANMAKWK